MQKIITSVSYISLNLIFYILSLQDVVRFLILPTSQIDFIQKAGKANIFARHRQGRIRLDLVCSS